MLNIGHIQQKDQLFDGVRTHINEDPFGEWSLTPRLTKLLIHAGFIRESAPAQPEEDKHNPSYELTNIGFHYILLDIPTQVHIMLRKFVEYVQADHPKYP